MMFHFTNWKTYVFLGMMLAAMSVMHTSAGNSSTVTNYARDTDINLHNPHMGWIYCDNTIPDFNDAGRSVPYINDGSCWGEVDYVALTADWSRIETSDGVYDWSMMDNTMDYWVGQGKKIELRFSTDPMLHLAQYPYGAPSWLYSDPWNVPYQTRQDWGYLDFNVPDYTNANYQQQLSEFMTEYANHFKNNPAVELAGLMAYGEWGEWHSGHDFTDMTTRHNTLNSLLDIWANSFSGFNGYLYLSTAYEWRNEMLPEGLSVKGPNPPSYDQYLYNSSLDYGFSLPITGVARYGIAGSIYPYPYYDGRLMMQLWRETRKPVRLESGYAFDSLNLPPDAPGAVAGYSVQNALDEATTVYHTNYMTMLGWDWSNFLTHDMDPDADSAIKFYNGQSQGWMQYALKNMGYRLIATQVTYPNKIGRGKTFSIDHSWENRAAGRLYVPYRVKFYLMNGSTVVWSGTDNNFDPSTILLGQAQTWRSTFTLPVSGLPKGTYDLRVALVDSSGTPKINLAMENGDSSKRYKVGSVQIDSTTTPAYSFVEGFESGSFATTNFVAASEYGTMTGTPSEVIQGEKSVKLSCPTSITWQDCLYTDVNKLPLEAGGTYKVSFMYKCTSDSGGTTDDPGRLYFVARRANGDIAYDKGILAIYDKQGNGAVSRSVIFTLDNFSDYRLQWGLHYGGNWSIDQIKIEQISPSAVTYDGFESGIWDSTNYYPAPAGSLTTTYAQHGSYGVLGEAAFDWETRTPEWTEFMWSNPGKIQLQPNTSYTISFMTQQLASPGFGGSVYFLARTPTGGYSEDCGFTKWMDIPLDWPAQKSVTFVTGDYSDYYLIWGLRNGGKVAVDDITLVKNGTVP